MVVFNFNTYQIVDSSSLTNPITIEFKKNGLELIEEVDETIALPTPKNNNNRVKIDTTTLQVDTFYGIKNEGEIPTRNFQTHTVKEEENPLEVLFNPTPKPTNIASWQIIILIVATLMLGFAKAFSNSKFKQTIRALTKYSVAQEINREEKVFFHRTNILFILIYTLIISLFIYHLKESINFKLPLLNDLIFYLIIVAALVVMYMIKYLFSKLLFFILDDINLSSEYIFNVSLYNNLLGVLFVPIVGIIYFSSIQFNSILVYLAIPLILTVFLLRIIRLFVIGKTKAISYFYIFLYICTLEILPLVVLYRIFILK